MLCGYHGAEKRFTLRIDAVLFNNAIILAVIMIFLQRAE
jgi:hypothetical protein